MGAGMAVATALWRVSATAGGRGEPGQSHDHAFGQRVRTQAGDAAETGMRQRAGDHHGLTQRRE